MLSFQPITSEVRKKENIRHLELRENPIIALQNSGGGHFKFNRGNSRMYQNANLNWAHWAHSEVKISKPLTWKAILTYFELA